ncbi:MAG: ABC transporter permease [Firmicutes bacterium]|nr:ABC transporter permease [Bacillota bacterium]
MYKAYVFVKRGLVSMLSYRMAFVLTLLGTFIGAVQFFFMAKFLGEGHEFPLLAPYGGNLMGYLIIGTTFMSFVGVSLNSFQGAIRGEQQMGTLEFLLMSDTPLHQILIYSALWNFMYACLSTSVIFLVVVFVLGMDINVNLGAALFVLLLSVVCMSGFGLMSAGIIMVTKQGDPITWAFGTLSGLLSGAMFPIELLPPFLRNIAVVLPPTHALIALRKTIMVRAGLGEVRSQVLALLALTALTLPIGLVVFRWGFNRARIDGSLAEY